MKKLIFFFALCLCLTGKASQPQYTVLEHPNCQDSVHVVKTVNGVTTVISMFVGERPIIKKIIDSPEFSGGVVALILAIWRFFEKRKLRRKGLLKDRVKASNDVLEGKEQSVEHFEETVDTWQNTDLYKIWLKISGGGATMKNDYGDPKEGIRTASQIGNANGGANFNNGNVTPQTLRTVEALNSMLNLNIEQSKVLLNSIKGASYESLSGLNVSFADLLQLWLPSINSKILELSGNKTVTGLKTVIFESVDGTSQSVKVLYDGWINDPANANYKVVRTCNIFSGLTIFPSLLVEYYE